MKEVIGIGKTIFDANLEAMRKLALGDDDRIEQEIIEVPVKGFLGIWGSQPAELKLKIEIKNPINKINTIAATSEEEKARLLLGEDFDAAIIFWAGIYSVKINNEIMSSMAVQAINALWQKIGIEKDVAFYEKLKAFILLIDEDRLANEMNIIKRFYAGEFKWESTLEQEAQSKGISVEGLIEIRKTELENAKLFRKMQKEKLKKLEGPAKIVRESYPQFDLELELQNEAFNSLINAGVDMQIAYEVLNKDILFQKKVFSKIIEATPKTIEEYFDILKAHEDTLIAYQQSNTEPEQSEEDLIKRAEECGISLEHLKELKQMERENHNALIESCIAICKKQAEAAEKLQYKYPQFDIIMDLSNPTFKRLVFRGVDINLAYELIHFNELYEKVSVNEIKTPTSTPLSKKLFCRICGEELPSDSKFCLHCGTEVIK